MNELILNNTSMFLAIKFFLLLYSMNKTHILNNLIIIEFMAVTLTAMMVNSANLLSMEMYLILFVVILLITESIAGLSLLINIIRTHSNDYLKSSSIILC